MFWHRYRWVHSVDIGEQSEVNLIGWWLDLILWWLALAFAIGVLLVATMPHHYFLVDGPDFRQVDADTYYNLCERDDERTVKVYFREWRINNICYV